MATLPQLIEEDMQRLDDALREFIRQPDATAALIIDKGGFLITHQGDASQFDVTTIGALASGGANQCWGRTRLRAGTSSVSQERMVKVMNLG